MLCFSVIILVYFYLFLIIFATIRHDYCTVIFTVQLDGENMASITKIKNKNGTVSYRVFISNSGKRESRTFSNKGLAMAWGEKRETEIERAMVYGEPSNDTIKDVIERYQKQFSSGYGRSKNYAIANLLNYDLVNKRIAELSPKLIISHCIARNQEAKPQTVLNDVIWLRTILKTMSATEGFDYDPLVFDRAMTVLKNERLVARSTERIRRPTKEELWKLSRHFYKSRSKLPMLELMWFAIYSARRLSEITSLKWTDNNSDRLTGMVRDAKHPTDKKGNHLRFKYTKSAWKIVQRQPKTAPAIFPHNPRTIGATFKRACKILNIKDLHWHDLRHEAASRLFEAGYSIDQVQLFTLHRDWKTLQRYTHLKAEDID